MDELVPALPPWSRPITELDLRSAGITSVVWCSGYPLRLHVGEAANSQ